MEGVKQLLSAAAQKQHSYCDIMSVH